MRKPVKGFLVRLEAMEDELVDLRESKANPCDEENVEGRCPCDKFDHALQLIREAQETLKTL